MSVVSCQVLGDTYQVLHVDISGGAIWWRVCYQWGLPRLVPLTATASPPLIIVVYSSPATQYADRDNPSLVEKHNTNKAFLSKYLLCYFCFT